MCVVLNMQVNGYPSSFFDTTKLVFTRPYRHLTTLDNSLSPTPCDKVCTLHTCLTPPAEL